MAEAFSAKVVFDVGVFFERGLDRGVSAKVVFDVGVFFEGGLG